MGEFPSGQRGQTVNLLSVTSVVRIHHLPPEPDMLCMSGFSYAHDHKIKVSKDGCLGSPVKYGVLSVHALAALLDINALPIRYIPGP